MLWCYLRSLELLGFPATTVRHGQECREGELNSLGQHADPKHGSLPRAVLAPRGYQCTSCWPCWGWRRSCRHWLSPAGSTGAGQSAWPRQGWRWARRPPRMLYHEEILVPAPPPRPRLPACQLVLHPCWQEGGGGTQHRRSAAHGVQQRRAGGSKPHHTTTTTTPGQQPEAFAAAGAEPKPGLQNPAELRRLSKHGQTLTPGASRPSAGAASRQQFPRDFADAPATAVAPTRAEMPASARILAQGALALPILTKQKKCWPPAWLLGCPLREGEEDRPCSMAHCPEMSFTSKTRDTSGAELCWCEMKQPSSSRPACRQPLLPNCGKGGEQHSRFLAARPGCGMGSCATV